MTFIVLSGWSGDLIGEYDTMKEAKKSTAGLRAGARILKCTEIQQ